MLSGLFLVGGAFILIGSAKMVNYTWCFLSTSWMHLLAACLQASESEMVFLSLVSSSSSCMHFLLGLIGPANDQLISHYIHILHAL